MTQASFLSLPAKNHNHITTIKITNPIVLELKKVSITCILNWCLCLLVGKSIHPIYIQVRECAVLTTKIVLQNLNYSKCTKHNKNNVSVDLQAR